LDGSVLPIDRQGGQLSAVDDPATESGDSLTGANALGRV
jgi:hypothetical protein